MTTQDIRELSKTNSQTPSPAAKQTVLIVDDHPTNMNVLFDFLKASGLSVQAVTTHQALLVTGPDIIETFPLFDAESPPTISSLLVVSLLSHAQAIGILSLGLGHSRHLSTSEEVQLAETIAGQLSSIVEVSRLLSK